MSLAWRITVKQARVTFWLQVRQATLTFWVHVRQVVIAPISEPDGVEPGLVQYSRFYFDAHT